MLLAWIASAPVGAQTTASSPAPTDSLGYNLPPDNILSVMRPPSPPIPLVSPADDTILLVSLQDYPSIARVATPFLRLAGASVSSPRITAGTILAAATALLPVSQALNWFGSPMAR